MSIELCKKIESKLNTGKIARTLNADKLNILSNLMINAVGGTFEKDDPQKCIQIFTNILDDLEESYVIYYVNKELLNPFISEFWIKLLENQELVLNYFINIQETLAKIMFNFMYNAILNHIIGIIEIDNDKETVNTN